MLAGVVDVDGLITDPLAITGSWSQDKVVRVARSLLATKYFMLASFQLLLYEHIATFPQEVDRIWNQPRSLASLLFCLGRYLTIVQFIIALLAFHQNWSEEFCSNWYRLVPGLSVLSIAFAESILILRTYALYNRDKLVLLLMLALLGGQITTMAYCVWASGYIHLQGALNGCMAVSRKSLGVAYYLAPMTTDIANFVLTVTRTLRFVRNPNIRSPLPRIVLRDGITYFVLIVTVNISTVCIYMFGTPDLKILGASFSQTFITILVSRMQLNLLAKSVIPLPHGHSRSNGSRSSVPRLAPYQPRTPEPPTPPPLPPATKAPVLGRSRGFARMMQSPPGAAIMPYPSMMMYPIGPVPPHAKRRVDAEVSTLNGSTPNLVNPDAEGAKSVDVPLSSSPGSTKRNPDSLEGDIDGPFHSFCRDRDEARSIPGQASSVPYSSSILSSSFHHDKLDFR